MKRTSAAPSLSEWGVISFGLWHSRDILQAWQHSPRDRGGAIVFGLWLLPFFIACFRNRGYSPTSSLLRSRLSILAITIILAGAMGDLNALVYGGFALAVAAREFEAAIGRGLIWWFASVAWMPAFSYFTYSLPYTFVLASKFALVIGTVVAISLERNHPKSK